MPRLQVFRRAHNRRERGRIVRYEPGDRFDGSENELRQFKDRLRDVTEFSERARVAAPDQRPKVSPGAGGGSGNGGGGSDDSGGAGGDGGGEGREPVDTSELTVAQLRKMGEELEIALPARATKAELQERINAAISSM